MANPLNFSGLEKISRLNGFTSWSEMVESELASQLPSFFSEKISFNQKHKTLGQNTNAEGKKQKKPLSFPPVRSSICISPNFFGGEVTQVTE